MDLVVDHSGQQPGSPGVDDIHSLICSNRIINSFNPPVSDQQVAFADDIFIHHAGVLDKDGIGHMNLRSSGYGVMTAVTKGVASPNSLDSKPAAA
jgi:hypothetical protein